MPTWAMSVIDYARSHNLSKLVIGRDPARRLWPWQRSSGQKLALLGARYRSHRDRSSRRRHAERGRKDVLLAGDSSAESSDRHKFKRLRYLWRR